MRAHPQEMGINIKRYLNPHAQVRVRLLDDRGLVLDHARFAASELLNNERRLVLLDERTCTSPTVLARWRICAMAMLCSSLTL